jgi:hypothetical protein
MTDQPGGGGSGYATQLESLRSTAKWLVAAFAGVAVLLVSGLQLSGIGALSPSSWRLYLAVGSVTVALAAVGYMIKEASVVLTHEWLTLATFGDEPGGVLSQRKQALKQSAQLELIENELAVSRHELFGYAAATIAQLHTRLRECDERIWRAKPDSYVASEAQREAALLRQAARDAVQYANYYFTLKSFQKMRLRLGWAAGVVAVSVGIFAYAATPPAHNHSAPARVSTAK